MNGSRLLPLVLLCLSFSAQALNLPVGVIDLREKDFNKNEVPLDGIWEFYWQQLLTPDSAFERSELVPFPSVWSGIPDRDLPNKGFATYRVKVLLPLNDHSYTLHVEDMFSSFGLFWNGQQILANGKVATTREQYQPQWKPDFIELRNVRDTNELVLQIANFDHRKGGSSQSLTIGESSMMKAKLFSLWTYDLLLTGSLLIGGLFLLGLYFFGHHDKAIFYFALFCIVYSYRGIGAGFYELHHLIDWSWYLLSRLEYITLFVSVFLFSRFVYSLYPEVIKKEIFTVLNVICIGFAVMAIFTPASVFTFLMTPFLMVTAAYIGVAFYIYILAYRKKLIGSQYALGSTAVVLAILMYDMLIYFNFLERVESVNFWGKELFLFSQSLILSYRFAYTLKSEKHKAEKASQAKSEFLSTISHEIRTPLNAVVGLSHLLLTENPRDDQRDNLLSLKYSAEHLTALINDILDFNKLESGSVEFEEMSVNLRELGERIVNIYSPKAEENYLHLEFVCDDRINSSLLLDATRLSQILNNLIDNAIKFTREGSVVLRMIMVKQNNTSQKIRFEVSDTGIGIPSDKQAVIFERFTQASSSTTREFGGTGLGLSIIKKLLELQGSQIKLSSYPGEGSTFYFTLKFTIDDSRKLPADDEVVMDEAQLQGRKVLLVEDNKINVVVASKFLTKWGIAVDHAENGEEGVEKASSTSYDLILMDLQMPVMDGYEASRLIREKDTSIPIIALTASALFRVQEGIFDAGMNDFVLKPFDPQELKRKLSKFLPEPAD
ncbi:ATP-binding protein [Marinoscillum sp. MHG1-6]|uniref:ATP-binding protein n=1 Tax=Marinoscillum sp. MHG1-6 TaxID=2959627 RepID=UPI002157F634|nr:ATP-binding protein [Marinoscillum sp. MHG1-6]